MGNENDGAIDDVVYNSDGSAGDVAMCNEDGDEDIDEDGSNSEDTDPDLMLPSQCAQRPRVVSDSDLELPPRIQPLRVEPDSESDLASVSLGCKRKLVYSSDNLFSSEAEIVGGVGDAKAKPALQRLTSTVRFSSLILKLTNCKYVDWRRCHSQDSRCKAVEVLYCRYSERYLPYQQRDPQGKRR